MADPTRTQRFSTRAAPPPSKVGGAVTSTAPEIQSIDAQLNGLYAQLAIQLAKPYMTRAQFNAVKAKVASLQKRRNTLTGQHGFQGVTGHADAAGKPTQATGSGGAGGSLGEAALGAAILTPLGPAGFAAGAVAGGFGLVGDAASAISGVPGDVFGGILDFIKAYALRFLEITAGAVGIIVSIGILARTGGAPVPKASTIATAAVL